MTSPQFERAEALGLLNKRRQAVLNEKAWLEAITQGSHNQPFHALPHNRRHHAHEGRTFVAWQYQSGQPVIRALLRIDQFTLQATQGMRIQVDISMPDRVIQQEIGMHPKAVGDLDLYLWVPAYNEVRFIPVNPTDHRGHRILQVQFMARTSGHPDQDRQDGDLSFDSVANFSKLWPAHAF